MNRRGRRRPRSSRRRVCPLRCAATTACRGFSTCICSRAASARPIARSARSSRSRARAVIRLSWRSRPPCAPAPSSKQDDGSWFEGGRKFDNHDELFAIGLGAARTGDMKTVDLARQELARRAAAPRTGDFRPIVSILERQMGALLRRSQDAPAAVALLREAATAEEQLPDAAGPPVVIKPNTGAPGRTAARARPAEGGRGGVRGGAEAVSEPIRLGSRPRARARGQWRS